MKRIKFTHQFSLTYALSFIIIIICSNYVLYQSRVTTFNEQQKSLCEFILSSLSPGIEYGLSFGIKSDIDQTLYPLRNNPKIAYARVVDTQGTVVSQIDNRAFIGLSQNLELQTFDKDVAQTLSSNLDGDFPSQLTESAQNNSRRLGKIQIASTPYEFHRNNENLNYLLLNAVIIIPMVLFWVYLFVRQSHQAKIVKKLIDVLSHAESYKDFKESMKTNEGTDLLNAVGQQVLKTQNLRHKLNILKSEVQQARLDANTELHEFIGFITQQDFNSSINNLMLFYKIIKQPVDKTRSAVWCRDLLTQSIAELSNLAKEKDTLVQDSFSGNRMNHQVHVDEKSLKQMLQLLLQQLIIICERHSLNIHFDLREDYQDTANLRISFSSESERFIEAVNEQSLFQFKEELPVTVSSNNIQLISAKHLLKKFAGEYMYFSDEVRLEMPLKTLNSSDKKAQPEPIAPLGVNLNVMVYDSDPIDKMVLIGYLKKLGIDVDKATTKQVVLQKLRHENYDAILVNSDFIKDDESFSFENFLHELEQLENIPSIIVVSRDNSFKESDAFQQLNNAHFITKPVDPKTLGERLSNL